MKYLFGCDIVVDRSAIQRLRAGKLERETLHERLRAGRLDRGAIHDDDTLTLSNEDRGNVTQRAPFPDLGDASELPGL
ncbi:MAG: hypothetical protein U0935_22240 [Pirellulales bacterium]